MVADQTGCSLWRVLQPFAELQRQGYSAEWGPKDDPRLGLLAPLFDAIVLPRLSWSGTDRAKGVKWGEAMHKAGKTIIYEVDDDLFSPWAVDHQAKGIGKERPAHQLEWERQDRIFALNLCDGVTVSTQRLATVVREYTDAPVEVVPNALDLRWWRSVQATGARKIPPVTVGWAGGARPDRDVTAMAEAWGRIARRFPKVTFVVQGYQPESITEFVPPERVRRIPWLALEVYPLGLLNIDVGCCPLADVPFNRCKTPIKAWEYAVSGAAVVASPTVYGQVIRHGENGYLASTADEWEDGIARLLEDTFHRREVGGRLRTDITERYSLEQNAWKWPAAWQSIRESHLRESRPRPAFAVA